MGPSGAKRAQEGQNRAPQTYDLRINSMFADNAGGHFGDILGYHGASGANLGVSCLRGFLGRFFGLCRVKLRATCCEDGK